MNPIKIRCSSLGDVMSDPRSKSELLSKTCIKAGVEAYLIQKYGKEKKQVVTDAIEKGLMVEEDAITTLSLADGAFYAKNEQWLINDYITGTPDIITESEVVDIKSSWDIFTFYASKFDPMDKGYWWQLQGYMALTGKKYARLAYVLIDTPEPIIASMQRKAWYDAGSPAIEDGYVNALIRNNATYTLGAYERTHILDVVEYDDDAMCRAYERIHTLRGELARILD